MACKPVAPSGTGGRRSPVCVSPVESVARTRTSWSPAAASHRYTHWTQRGRSPPGPASPPPTGRRRPGPRPRRCPGCGAQATPAIGDRARRDVSPPPGTSMRDCVLIGAVLATSRGGSSSRRGLPGRQLDGAAATWSPTRSRRARARRAGPGSRAERAAARRSCRSRPSRRPAVEGARRWGSRR